MAKIFWGTCFDENGELVERMSFQAKMYDDDIYRAVGLDWDTTFSDSEPLKPINVDDDEIDDIDLD